MANMGRCGVHGCAYSARVDASGRAEYCPECAIDELQAEVRRLRAELQAAQAVAPLPKGWSESHGKGWWECEHSASGVILHADAVGPAIYTREGCDLHFAPVNQLITVLRHAQAAHARLRDGMPTPTPAQEGQ